MSYFVPTRFVWRFGGRQVHLCGSFTRWVETVPMAPVDNTPGFFAVVVHLPPGYHQYKFIVDGKWRHDETAPFMPDPLGNVNNWLFVRRIDLANTQLPRDIPLEQLQSAVAQQQAAQAQAHAAQQALALGLEAPGAAAAAASVAGAAGVPLPNLSVLPLADAQGLPLAAPSGVGLGAGLGVGQAPPPPPLDDTDMANVEGPPTPIVIHNPKEPEYTRKKIGDFLHSHTAFELIPESGRVTILDVDLPVRQAFHALHEQGVASAPLWDGRQLTVCGVISASDFIRLLTALRSSIAGGANPLSEAEMDVHTIRSMRDAGAAEGRHAKPLVHVHPDDDLSRVVTALTAHNCSMAPVLTADPSGGGGVPVVLHAASLSGVLSSLMRHFRASVASLPLLGLPLGSLPLGTWSPDASVAHSDVMPDSKERRQWRKLQPLHTVTSNTPLTVALGLLLDAGVSCLPVVDARRRLVDVYARADIAQLCKGNAYSRLQWEDVTVGQALLLGSAGVNAWGAAPSAPAPGAPAGGADGMPPGGLSAELHAAAAAHSQAQTAAAVAAAAAAGPNASPAQQQGLPPGPSGRAHTRVHMCSKDDPLRLVVERLSVPGVRRLVVVQQDTRRVEGIVSLSDVAQYLFL